MLRNQNNKSKIFLLAISVILLLSAIALIIDYNISKSNNIKVAIENASMEVKKSADKIDSELKKIMAIADNLADEINNNGLDSTEIFSSLKEGVIKYPEIFGFGVGFEPYKWAKNRRLYAPFYIKRNGARPILTFIDTSYDYTAEKWYITPRDSGKDWFEPPYYGTVSQTFIAEYSAPLYDTANHETIGLTYIDISFRQLINIINKVTVGKSGYGFLLSRTGNYMVHPISEWVKSEKNINEYAKEINDTSIIELFNNGIVDGKKYLETTNALNGLQSTLMFETIPSTGWKLGVMFFEEDFAGDIIIQFRKRLVIVILLTLSSVLFLLFLYTARKSTNKRLWITSISISLFFLISIGVIWYLNISRPFTSRNNNKELIITEKSVLKKFVQIQDSISTKRHEDLALKIPVGVFIEHLEFAGPNTIKLSGIIWEKFDTASTHIKKGIYFPETSPDAESLTIQELYRKEEGGTITIARDFRIAIRQNIYFAAYPFDRQSIKLRIWSNEINKNVMLIPDIDSYSITNPALLPGIEENFVLRGWKTVASYFSYIDKHYNTGFGVKHALADRTQKELAFNIAVERNFLGPFISRLIPLFVISILLFTIVLSTSNKEKDIQLGFSGFGVLEICAAFYFVVILSHIDFRNTLGLQEIVYFDYFYFLVYLKILVYAVNSVILSKSYKFDFIQQRNNLYPRVLYWPVYLGLLFIITCFIFY